MAFNAKVCPSSNVLVRSEYNVVVTNEVVSLKKDDAKKVDDYWKIASQAFPNLFRKPIMLSLDGYELGGGYRITEHSRLVDYAMFVAKGNQDLEPRSAGLSQDAVRRINAQSASSITITSDGYAVFGTRPANVLAPNQITNIPEGMLRVSTPNPFDFLVERLGKELVVQKDSVKAVLFTGNGYELDYFSVVSSFAILLGLSRAQIEEAQKERKDFGAPSNLIFKDTTLAVLKGFLREDHPGSSNIATLNFINWYHGRRGLESTVAELGIKDNVMGTMEEFCASTGIGLAGKTHQPGK